MARPDDTLWELHPDSAGKHVVLRKYLDRWLPVISSAGLGRGKRQRIVLVDGFAGPGTYLGGQDGSPIIMLKAFLEHAHQDQIAREVHYVFIEAREDRVDRLREEIRKLDLGDRVTVETGLGRFEDVFGPIMQQREGSSFDPTFAFIDPFGYSDVKMDLAGQLLQFRHCEALIYLPLPFIARFVGLPEQEATLDATFGTPDWRKARDLQGGARRDFLRDLFLEQLRADAGAKHVRAFEIPSSDGHQGYYLFFATGDDVGLEKMKEAMWKADPLFGTSYRDMTDPLQPVLFQPEPDTTPLRNHLKAHFGERVFTIEEAERTTLLDTAFLPKSHLKTKTLKVLEKEGLLRGDPSSRSKPMTYPPGTRMRFLRQSELDAAKARTASHPTSAR